MRDYRKKMAKYRISRERYVQLRNLCMDPQKRELVEAALKAMGDSGLSKYILLHVTTKQWEWRHLEAAGIPCSADTFRIYRAKFYWFLDSMAGNGAKI